MNLPPSLVPTRTKSSRRAFLLLGFLWLPLGAAQAADYTVATGNSAGNGTLAAAITSANATPGADTIIFAGNITDIVLTEALPTITDELTITGRASRTVVRFAQFPTNSRVFTIENNIPVTLSNLELKKGNVTGFGGAVNNSGILAMTNCTVSDNKAGSGGGLSNFGGTVTLTGCTFSSNAATTDQGGAILNSNGNDKTGTVSLLNCLFQSNSASSGAGISSEGTLTVTASTFLSNIASGGTGDGGAISNLGSATLRNCSIGGNQAINGGGIFNNASAVLSLDSVTLVNNKATDGGGILNDGTTAVSLANTLVASNTRQDETASRSNLAGPFSGTFNLISIGAGSTGLTNGVGNNLVGSATTPKNPLFSPAADNGGPTPTFALLPGSVGLSAGSTPLNTDQRGVLRPRRSPNDIGAFELDRAPVAYESAFTFRVGQASSARLFATDPDGDVLTYQLVSGSLPPGLTLEASTGIISGTPTTMTTGTVATFKVSDTTATSAPANVTFQIVEAGSLVVNTNLESTYFDTKTSLREAIAFANFDPDTSAITFDLPVGSRTITLDSALPKLATSLSITGPTTGGGVTIKRNSAADTAKFRIFYCDSGTIDLAYLTISGGATTDNGGGIYNYDSILTVTNCTISGNTARDGGGVQTLTGVTYTGSLTSLHQCTITGNSAMGLGGGVRNFNGQLTFVSCTIAGNFASAGQHAGLDTYGDETTRTEISHSIIAGNLTTGTPPASGLDVGFGSSSQLGLISNGYNLIGDGEGTTYFAAPGDQTGVADAALKLGALANNGGPTLTLALLAGSPAINSGDPAFDGTGQFDQRGDGFPRLRNGRRDIGAFENQNNSPVFNNATFTFIQNQSISGAQLAATDADGDVLTYTTNNILPSGVTLNANGSFSGTPTVARAGINILVKATDATGGSDSALIILKVLDRVAPTVVIASPTNAQNLTLATFTAITGSATDNVGVSQVQLKFFRTRNGVTTFWNGTSFGAAQTLLTATLASPGATRTAWSYPVSEELRSALDLGTYSIAAYGKDAENNLSGAVGRNFNLIVDTTAPAPAISTPRQNENVKTPSFTSITGTASDNVGVTQILIKFFRTRGGVTTFWNGTSFGTAQVQLPATVASPGATSTGWSFPIDSALKSALDDGAYLIAAYGKDAAGNLSGAVGRNFTLYSDFTLPTATITSPTQNQSLPIASFNQITGSATDNVGVNEVLIRLFRIRSGVTEFWNGSNFTATQTLLPATLATPGATSSTWSYPVSTALKSALDSGPYLLAAYSKDAVGNQSPAQGRNFTLTSSATLQTAPSGGSANAF